MNHSFSTYWQKSLIYWERSDKTNCNYNNNKNTFFLSCFSFKFYQGEFSTSVQYSYIWTLIVVVFICSHCQTTTIGSFDIVFLFNLMKSLGWIVPQSTNEVSIYVHTTFYRRICLHSLWLCATVIIQSFNKIDRYYVLSLSPSIARCNFPSLLDFFYLSE